MKKISNLSEKDVELRVGRILHVAFGEAKTLEKEKNNRTKKVSVIIPVYNVEDYLKEALDSLCNQTHTNFEAICINDGSTDNSLNILNEYSNKDNRFKVITQENLGQGIARNKAIDMATGDYIFFLDPDDWIDNNTFEILIDKINQHDDIDFIQFDYINERGNFGKNKITKFKKSYKKGLNFSLENNEIYNWHYFKKIRLGSFGLAIWNRLYTTKFIKENNIKLAPNKHGEDHIFSFKSIFSAKKILYVEKALYHYRMRIGSAVNKASNDNFCIFENIEYLREFLTEQNLLEKLNKEFREYMVNVLNWHYTCIPEDGLEDYIKNVNNILTPKEYKTFLKRCNGKFSLIEQIFSIKNRKIQGVRYKVVKILGFQFDFEPKTKRNA